MNFLLKLFKISLFEAAGCRWPPPMADPAGCFLLNFGGRKRLLIGAADGVRRVLSAGKIPLRSSFAARRFFFIFLMGLLYGLPCRHIHAGQPVRL